MSVQNQTSSAGRLAALNRVQRRVAAIGFFAVAAAAPVFGFIWVL